MAISGRKAKPLKEVTSWLVWAWHRPRLAREPEKGSFSPRRATLLPPAPSGGTGKGERRAALARRTARHRHLQQSAGREKPNPARRNHYSPSHEPCDPGQAEEGQKNEASLRAPGTETGSRYLRVEGEKSLLSAAACLSLARSRHFWYHVTGRAPFPPDPDRSRVGTGT